MTRSQPSLTRLTDDDVYLWNEGTHYRLYEKLGAHHDDNGTHFAVWAPNAERVSVVGDWNGWDPGSDPYRLSAVAASGHLTECHLRQS